MSKHCVTCKCELLDERRERERLEREKSEREKKEREFVRAHSILRDEDLSWARGFLARHE
jgi:hypothetical protein